MKCGCTATVIAGLWRLGLHWCQQDLAYQLGDCKEDSDVTPNILYRIYTVLRCRTRTDLKRGR